MTTARFVGAVLLAGAVAVAAGAPATVTIRDVQYVEDVCANRGDDRSPFQGKVVHLERVYVTSASAYRFTVSDDATVAAWGSILVDVPRLEPDLVAEGMRVSLTGRVLELGRETVVADVVESAAANVVGKLSHGDLASFQSADEYPTCSCE